MDEELVVLLEKKGLFLTLNLFKDPIIVLRMSFLIEFLDEQYQSLPFPSVFTIRRVTIRVTFESFYGGKLSAPPLTD